MITHIRCPFCLFSSAHLQVGPDRQIKQKRLFFIKFAQYFQCCFSQSLGVENWLLKKPRLASTAVPAEGGHRSCLGQLKEEAYNQCTRKPDKFILGNMPQYLVS
jgi:hypothetical protein